MEEQKQTPHWRIILAAFLDFVTAAFTTGYIISMISGESTENGFKLSGISALLCFALIVVYFWAGKKYFGRTIWKRILNVPND